MNENPYKAPKSGRWLRFTIRDIFWLTTLVAVALALRIAWMKNSWRWATEINEMNRTHHAEMETLERAYQEKYLKGLIELDRADRASNG